MLKKPADKQVTLLVCAGLVLAVAAAYEPLRYNSFIHYDDNRYITDNPHVKGGLTTDSLIWAFTDMHFYMWHPLTSLSHIMDVELFGLNPVMHHLMSMLIHAANAVLLYLVLRRMTGNIWCSAFVAAVFAVHPLQVESVAWAAERKTVMSGLFWLLTIAAYARYAQRPAVRQYLCVLLIFGLCIMAKPMVVTLPAALLLLDWWPLGTRRRETGWRRLLAEKAPLFVLSGFLGAVTIVASRAGGAVWDLARCPLDVRISNAVVSYVEYIRKAFWPSGLAVFYPHPGNTLTLWRVLTCLLVLLTISITVVLLRGKRYLTVGWLWYLGTLIPVIGLVQAGGQAMADRYFYIPSIGLLIILAWGINDFCPPRLVRQGEAGGNWRYKNAALASATVVIITALLFCTRTQVRYWRNDITLCEHTLAVTKNNRGIQFNYAKALYQAGRVGESLTQLDCVLRLDSQDAGVLSEKGMVLLESRRVNEAIQCFEEALRVDPNHVASLNNLGMALKQQGQVEQAIATWHKALAVAPKFPSAHCGLAMAYLEQGKRDLAISHFEKALERMPEWLEVLLVLEKAYADSGQTAKAAQTARRAIVAAKKRGRSDITSEIEIRLKHYNITEPNAVGMPTMPAKP